MFINGTDISLLTSIVGFLWIRHGIAQSMNHRNFQENSCASGFPLLKHMLIRELGVW